jgi:hypothetical protein
LISARLRVATAVCTARAPKARSGRYFHLFIAMYFNFSGPVLFAPWFASNWL